MVDSQRGSALVLSLLVAFVLSLLGLSFILMAQTESRIADNETRAAQALYLAESGVRAVKRWFDRPGTALEFPDTHFKVDRSGRRLVDETDPYVNPPRLPGTGVPPLPLYKQTTDAIFDRPYRDSLEDRLMGTEAFPDMRVDEDGGTALEQQLLRDLSDRLMPGFPSATDGRRARVSRIDVYAPPYRKVGAVWLRFGLATVRVTARIYSGSGPARRTIAEQTVRAVLHEVPYGSAYGPVHSCAGLSFTGAGDVPVHWGAMTAAGAVKLRDVADLDEIPDSLPRATSPLARVHPLWTTDPAEFDAFKNGVLEGASVEDPWFRVVAGGAIESLPGPTQPYPVTPSPPAACCDHSNLIHNLPVFGCPEFGYDFWKAAATSGYKDVHYFAWKDTDRFMRDGVEAAQGFATIVQDAPAGLYFFDTQDGRPPDGTNLTPAIVMTGRWNGRGFVFLNATRFQLSGATGDNVSLQAPGEPFIDADDDGRYDAGEDWVNLDYGTDAVGFEGATADTFGGSNMRNDRGPGFDRAIAFHGVLYTTGEFEATGTGSVYGSVIARMGVVQNPDDGSQPTPRIYWDAAIGREWPPPGWDVPRVAVTGWLINP